MKTIFKHDLEGNFEWTLAMRSIDFSTIDSYIASYYSEGTIDESSIFSENCKYNQGIVFCFEV